MAADDSSASSINDDTVDALVETVRDFLRTADAREQSFNNRAGGLAGFAGIIASIATAAGKVVLDAHPSHCAAIAAAVAFGVAALALFLSVAFAVIKVLLPQSSAAIGMDTIDLYPTWAYIDKDKVMVQGELLRGLITTLGKDRLRIDSKATWLRRAYMALLVGIGALAVFGGIVVVDAV